MERTEAECEALLLEFDPTIRSYARHVTRHGFAEYDDVLQDGRVGAWQAAHTWDGGDKASYRTHAYARMTGEIKDGLRRRDVVSRRSKWDPDDPRLGAQVSLSTPLGDATGSLVLGDLLVDADPGPEFAVVEAAYLSWQVDQAQKAMRMLSAYERDVINYYYWGGLTLLQIAERMGFTESRASQIVSKCLGVMYRRMSASDELIAS